MADFSKFVISKIGTKVFVNPRFVELVAPEEAFGSAAAKESTRIRVGGQDISVEGNVGEVVAHLERDMRNDNKPTVNFDNGCKLKVEVYEPPRQ